MSVDQSVMALRYFIARRGKPDEIFDIKGTLLTPSKPPIFIC